MQNPKDQLIQLVEAYSAAKASGNVTLIQFAANSLSSFLGSVEIVAQEGSELAAPVNAEVEE